DELTLVWNAEEDLYYSVRPDVDSEFGPRQPIPVVNSAAGETEPFVSADGCTLYFASDRPGSLGERDYYRASFEAR
ncbi:MAG: PD40 domain-containing protein, partial [Deltaproteobacteria bacterium]|nr:PD40 domain-containing protein [Deltaproteobacteria bacterium]